MLIDDNHSEPSNMELGIHPIPRLVGWSLVVIAGAGIWYLLYLAIS